MIVENGHDNNFAFIYKQYHQSKRLNRGYYNPSVLPYYSSFPLISLFSPIPEMSMP